MLNWKVPKLWPNSKVFILGGGPSLNQMDFSGLKDHWVIGVNNSAFIGDFVDVLFFGDCKWYDHNREAIRAFGGIKVTTCNRSQSFPGVNHVFPGGKSQGLFPNPQRIVWNRNSGAAAINLAMHFGASRIVLLGYDMRVVDGKHNWHNDHPTTPPESIYEKRFLPVFPAIAKDAKRFHLEIVNATPGSALLDFPMVSLEDELK